MINRKQRPPNGPGANGLRANLNSYNSGKVLLGRWVDDHGGPIGYRRGFTTEDFQTECQHQQLGVVQKRPQLYGAALPAVEAVKNPFKPEDIFHPVTGLQPKDWSSNAHADFTTRDLVEYQPPMMMTREKLQEYRETWTTGREHERSSRFQTESVRAGNSAASAHLKVTQTRALPGAPIAVELFRKEILEIHGTLAFCALRYYLPPTTMTDDDLKSVAIKDKAFADIRVKMGAKKSPERYDQESIPSEISEDMWGEIPKL